MYLKLIILNIIIRVGLIDTEKFEIKPINLDNNKKLAIIVNKSNEIIGFIPYRTFTYNSNKNTFEITEYL